jgi:hypothetical protein
MDWIDLARDRGRWRVLVDNESSGSIKFGDFLNCLRNGQLLKQDSPPCSK